MKGYVILPKQRNRMPKEARPLLIMLLSFQGSAHLLNLRFIYVVLQIIMHEFVSQDGTSSIQIEIVRVVKKTPDVNCSTGS